MEEKYEVWEGLMDQAYSKWEKENWSKAEFIQEHCSDLERKAVLLGNLNYQVENGGFGQWVDNGYGIFWEDTVEVLRQVGTENAMKTINLINRFSQYINEDPDGYEWITEVETNCEPYYDEENDEWLEDETEEEENPGWDIACEISSEYYKFNQSLMDEIEEFLKNDGIPNPNLVKFVKDIKKPKPIVFGPIDGNSFAVMGAAKKAMEKSGIDEKEIKSMIDEATSGDYNHLLSTIMEYVELRV